MAISVELPVTQDVVVVLNPDGAFEGGVVVTGGETRALPPDDPDAANPLAVAVIYPGGVFTFSVGLDVDVTANQRFLTEEITVIPAGALSLGTVVRGIAK